MHVQVSGRGHGSGAGLSTRAPDERDAGRGSIPAAGGRADARLDFAVAPRTAVMGGTFNPPHLGHLLCAQEALLARGLDLVVWIPVNTPPHKSSADDPGVAHRLAMCRLATADDPRFAVSALEAQRAGASYTVDTLETLHAQAPGIELTFIVGGDMAAALPLWREPERIVRLARLVVAERDGHARDVILERVAAVPGAVERVQFFDMPRLDVSSSLIRRRVAAGRPVRYLVPDRVAQYIDREGLYGASREGVSE